MSPVFATDPTNARPIHLVEKDGCKSFIDGLGTAEQAWLRAQKFEGALGQLASLPGDDGPAEYAFGMGDAKARARGQFNLARLPAKLPPAVYAIAEGGETNPAEALGWLLALYKFDRYRNKPAKDGPVLVAPEGIDAARVEAIASGVYLTRDLINTPTNDMGPEQLETAFLSLADQFGARSSVIRGDALIDQNFPMIHAVGRASDQEPRLLELNWGPKDAPAITLVGKGVCFDTGGLNIKPGNSMALMKKDMGGAANTMGLAHMIMAQGLNLRLRLLVPAVENSISAGAYRPGDILTSRKGLTVEINNTDAEGRLVLADALALADEAKPEHIFCMATLTGAARVALGPDLAPFFTDDRALAAAISEQGQLSRDPVWEMPFWDGYEQKIEPGIADLDNAPSGGFAGAITAALFLRRFVTQTPSFAHFDIYGWTPSSKPGRPKGGDALGSRAIFGVLADRFGTSA